MRKTLWNSLCALATAAAIVAWAPSAFSASKKTPTPAAEAPAAKTTSDKSAKTEKVNLNTASEKDVAAAKGVGDKLAKELVAGRPYKTWDEVSKVKGVGTGKKLDSLKKVLKLSGGEAAAAAKEEPATKETKGKKSKSSSRVEETAAPAATGAAAGAGASGKASASSEPSSPSKKSSSSSSSSSSSEKLAPGTKININTASAEELDKLPEIGPVKAQAIVDYRKANGKFAAPEDVMKVSGIKEGTYAKIKDYIVVR
ncbi:MAG: helix-hairpin-helix domain-containing protein [Acidobacteria bacterium]|nr:helix-hairpin-helix domain-containing protein [Acidobacteriota bacterium]